MQKKKLKLRTETLRHLRQEHLHRIDGAIPPPSYNSCNCLTVAVHPLGPVAPVKDSGVDCATNFCPSLYLCDTFLTLTSL